jgi:peptidoglycan/xylan/chitin deacetylase (PgdA/CDA1 family)
MVMSLRRFAVALAPLPIVTYHNIANPDRSYPYDPEVVDASPAQFRRQMEMLARHAVPIGIDELVRALDGAALPANAVMVTFDDGYRSCHELALPILREVGIPATFFIPTTYVEQRRLYWWERIAILIRQAKVDIGILKYPYPFEVTPADPGSLDMLTAMVKNTPSLDVERFLDELGTALRVEWNHEIDAKHAEQLVMTWDQVRALVDAGMDVESHSRRHRVLQTLDDTELHDELLGSRLELEAQLGRPVRAIAYPVGRRISHIHRIRDAVRDAGYLIGFSNNSGVSRLNSRSLRRTRPVDRFNVRRLGTGRAVSDAWFLTQIAVPELSYPNRGDSD